MKKQILISLIISCSGLTMNAQWNGTNPVWTTSNVGIGTGYAGVGIISPVEKFTIGEMGGNFAVQDRRTSTTEKYSSGYKFYDYIGESASILLEHNSYFGNGTRALKFLVNGAERVRINANGFVGIGTTTPMTSLDIYGNTGMRISNSNSSAKNTYLYMGGHSNEIIGKSAIISVPNSAGWWRQDLCFALANGNDINSVSTSDIAMTIKSYTEKGEFGFVGIGTTTPMTSLDIYGNTGMRISNSNSSAKNTYLYMGGHSNEIIGKSAIISVPNSAGWWRQDLCFALANGNDMNSVTSSDIAMTIKSYVGPGKFGYVGIGTSTPAYKLDVCGTIRANEVKVDLLGTCVPDFVFKKDYKLMSLNELEKFVTTKQHLPEIASEKEMIEDGLNMKEFQMKLLQKIEELTLYTIEQNKQLKVQNDKIEKQSNKIEKQNQEFKILKTKIKKLESSKR